MSFTSDGCVMNDVRLTINIVMTVIMIIIVAIIILLPVFFLRTPNIDQETRIIFRRSIQNKKNGLY
jgi:uncharacterized protein YxeA